MNKKSNLVEVSVVFRKNSAILVEFIDHDKNPVRVSISTDSAELFDEGKKARVTPEVLDQGIPYGIPFEHRLRAVTVTPDEIANAFHRDGLWTSEDILKNQKAVISSLLSAFKISVSDILALATEFSKKES